MSNPNDTKYLEQLKHVADSIVSTIRAKDKAYGSSWKRRGGVGAYMMLVRKSDRLEEQVKKFNYDVFDALRLSGCSEEKGSERLIDTLEDLVAYGLLILAEHQSLAYQNIGDSGDIEEDTL